MCSETSSAPRKNAPSGFSFNGVPGRPVARETEDCPASMTRPFSTSSPVTKVRVDRVSLSNRANSARERLPRSFSNLKKRAWLICRMRLGVAMGKRYLIGKVVPGLEARCVCQFYKQTICHFQMWSGPELSLERCRSDAERNIKKLGSEKFVINRLDLVCFYNKLC